MGSPAFYTMALKYMKVGQHYYSTLLYLRMRAFGALTGVTDVKDYMYIYFKMYVFFPQTAFGNGRPNFINGVLRDFIPITFDADATFSQWHRKWRSLSRRRRRRRRRRRTVVEK